MKLYFNHNNPGEIDFGMAHLIRSKLLLPSYYNNLCNIRPWWRHKVPPPGYFMYHREMPSPIRICDMALDGIIYSKYLNKTDYYQQFFSKDSFDLSTILMTNNWSGYIRYSDKIQSIRDSIIDDLVNGIDLR